MTWFASVGQLRIQSYLSRTRHLWGRRGASLKLTELNAVDHIGCLVKAHGCTPNPYAMAVDGVVELYGATRDDVLAAARAVAYDFRTKLPGVISSIRIGEGTSERNDLAADYAASLGEEPTTNESILVAPAAAEYPPLALCDECGIDPAEQYEQVAYEGEPSRLCGDCAVREPAKEERRWVSVVNRLREETLFEVEARLLRKLNEGRYESDHVHGPRDFQHLAGWGAARAASDGRVMDNHLALINADGNGFGALFTGLRTHLRRVAPSELETWLGQMKELSGAAHDATKAALETATAELRSASDAGSKTTCPVVPHIMGGDDLLVSVPARFAWLFVQSFVTHANKGFSEAQVAMSTFAEEHPSLDGTALKVPELSMSAGVVICGVKFPFGDQVALSEQVLREAKDRVKGSASSIAWHDVTWEGNELRHHDRAWLVETPAQGGGAANLGGLPNLTDGKKLVDLTAALPQSGRQALWRVLEAPNPSVALSGLKRQEYRQQGVKEVSEAVPREWDKVAVIRDALSLARWW